MVFEADANVVGRDGHVQKFRTLCLRVNECGQLR
jgi:hypothetical protein